MIDLFAVVSFGGLVRWSFVSHKFDHLSLLNAVLNHLSSLDNLKSESEWGIGNNLVKWSVNEDLELIYILGHPKMFPIDWTGNLFKRIDNFIVKDFAEPLKNEPFYEFEDSSFSVRFKEAVKKEELRSKTTNIHQKEPKIVSKNKEQDESNTKRRSWNDKASKNEMASLDFSAKKSTNNLTVKSTADFDLNEKSKVDELSDFESDSEQFLEEQQKSTSWWNSFKSLTGNNPLTLEDLQPALKEMKMHLIGKNVASNSADFVVKAVGNRLEGRVPGTFSSISRMVRDATRETLQKILTPSKPNDLLNEIEVNRKGTGRRPFVMAFIGVNGVGKSTNLSKVAFWLLQHHFRVLLVAGDTFRAGAIEQLAHHCRNLNSLAPNRIEIYERGYGKDAALIAQDAIRYATDNRFDLVLIDTAGRMQDNGPLMVALAKLINLNKPDRVIFVGEALVGNDALSQLQKFNSALLDHSANPIDGILLTKVDTIDDKIGAALSMTLTAKAPILFMGVGQTYTDLRRINIRQVVDLLLK